MKTKVVFRKFAIQDSFSDNGDIIALFVDEQYSPNQPDLIMSYMQVGQHGGASRDLIDELEQATPEEYKSLYDELVFNIGYDLEIINR